ncbi:ABC transporter substrate-binding protein [Moritella sp. 24]|uniref:ABC transporter substrate-binding protein n=1 Tax=Moritella sp. 24 TaxID=2746230 RepID=UPI001BA7A9C0|nr:ABC transporter substrate-binding protein [Moritella sp. 24]QUM76054.1 ABC transporter substrate-binding protein [Moritella sp. 24]
MTIKLCSSLKQILLIALFIPSFSAVGVSINVCGDMVDYPSVPTRAVPNDINMLNIMLALDLKESMAAYSGVTAYNKISPALAAKLTNLSELAAKQPSVENLLNIDADFFFSGWNYGMPIGGPTTPDSLARFGIKTYLIKESCAHVQNKASSSLEDTFYDIDALGKIFNIESRADRLIASFKQRLSVISTRLYGVNKPAVFVYDSGIDKPFSAGGLATPNAIIEAAGGINILHDLAVSWGAVSWETVVDADPDHIVIIHYESSKAEDNIAFLKRFPITANLTAVKQNRFTIINYTAATPGIENVDAVEQLAHDLHPKRFK